MQHFILANKTMGDIYKLTFADGKEYVGASKLSAHKRFAVHRVASKTSKKGFVYDAWRLHGEPHLTILASVENDLLCSMEIAAIQEHGTLHPSGYNETPGGNIAPSLTPSVADKISKKLNGRKLSPETVEKIRAAVTGRKHTAKARENMSSAQRGKIVSVAARMKMALAKRGTTISDEKRAAMSAAQRARREREGCKPQRWRYP